ncbi:MAG: endonuclease domain-containing protein [Pseudomonadota bacterium]
MDPPRRRRGGGPAKPVEGTAQRVIARHLDALYSCVMRFDSTRRLAKHLRRSLTRAELALWSVVRSRRFEGLRFRRQHVLGPYVLDFYCPSARLVVELDGGAHDDEDAQLHDAARDEWIARQGLKVLRLPNHLVLDDMEAALERIMAATR